ncbi:MAG TPA: hypothetical protein VNT75_03475, partial [Symbiobacteriaceae bacterium]|nr:hypothetical protein [Symbiobacteriaceae bacterium]
MKFLTDNWRGLTIFALGALTVVLALTMLHVCGDEGHMVKTATGSEIAMRCTWTRAGVVGIAGLVAL